MPDARSLPGRARIGLQADAVRPARTMVREFPASPPSRRATPPHERRGKKKICPPRRGGRDATVVADGGSGGPEPQRRGASTHTPCRARIGLQADAVRPARTMVREFPASPPSLRATPPRERRGRIRRPALPAKERFPRRRAAWSGQPVLQFPPGGGKV